LPEARGRKTKMTCSRCGKVADVGVFYVSKSKTNTYYERAHVCKDCVEELYAEICEYCDDRKDSIIRLCSALDVAFSQSIYDNATNWYVKQPEGTSQIAFAKRYLSWINSSIGKNQGNCFYESENFGKIFGAESDDYVELKDKNRQLDDEIYELSQKISELTEEKEAAEIRADRREKEKQSAIEKMETAVESSRQLRELNQQINETIRQTSDQNKQLNENNKQLIKDLDEARAKIAELESTGQRVIESDEDIPEQYIFDWGEGFELKEYEYLNRELADWKSKNESDNGAQDILSREICVEKLNIRRKRSRGDDTSNNVKAIQSLITTGKFVPIKKENQDASPEIPWGVQIRDIEDFSPAEWIKDKKKFKDIDGISHYIKDHIIRSLKNFVTGSRDFDPGMDILNKVEDSSPSDTYEGDGDGN